MIDDNQPSTGRNPDLIHVRLANWGDAACLARVHHICSRIQPGGFMHELGFFFFQQYYKILLREPTSVILCATDGEHGIVAIASGTLDAGQESKALYAGRHKLLVSSLPAMLRRPRLLKAVHARVKLLSNCADPDQNPIQSGPRFSFWGCLPEYPVKVTALRLHRAFLNIMEDLGVESLRFETDVVNKDVMKISELLNAKFTKTVRLPDGRERALGFYPLHPEQRNRIILGKG